MISFEKSVGVIIFRKAESRIKYLLLHYRHGHWDFPKGHMEKGETEEETMRRELEEETGISDIKIIPEFHEKIRFFYKAKDDEYERRKKKGERTLIFKKVVFYLAETQAQDVKISFEHIGFEWLEFEKALERTTYRGPKRILKKANEYLLKQSNRQL